MNIAIVGTGYVGLVTGACFAEFGVRVHCVDSDEGKIEALRSCKIPIYEPGLEPIVERNVRSGRLSFSTDLGQAVEECLVIFIAVGTPQDPHHGRADISAVLKVAEEIAEHLRSYKVIVTKSTVPVGTGKQIRELIEKHRENNIPFSVASNPEFLREGSAIEDFMRPNRIVIGAEDEQAAAILKDLYRPLYLIETPILVTDLPSAELIKYASNAFLAVKISYINEIARLCEEVGADVHAIARGMGLDNRIGRKFLHAGPGYGGSCFPKDTRALVETGRQLGVPLRIVQSAIDVNDSQSDWMVEKIVQACGGIEGKTLAFLGLSFKPETDDVRESASLKVIRAVLDRGAKVRAYDPVAMNGARAALEGLDCRANEYEAAEGADGLVLATEWNQFRKLDLKRLKRIMRQPVLIDLRNIYEPAELRDLGFHYTCVGR
jgi:UDPglucose 6-dehydrogenase